MIRAAMRMRRIQRKSRKQPRGWERGVLVPHGRKESLDAFGEEVQMLWASDEEEDGVLP